MATTPEMAFTVETTGPCRKKVNVTIPPELVSDEFDKTYQNLIKTVPIQGFRQGRAPRGLIEKRYGTQVALEVKQTLLDNAYEKALKDHELSPLATPEVDGIEELEATPKSEMSFAFTVTVKPEFELPDIKGIEVSVPAATATTDELDAAIKDLRRGKATLRPIEDGAAEEGDVLTLDIHGRENLHGEEGGEEADDADLFHKEDLVYEIGSKFLGGLVSDDIDAAVTGQKPGADIEATAYAPPHEADHPLAGVDILIKAELLDIKRPDLPEVNDEFAKSLDYDDLDELNETVGKQVENRKSRERDKQIEDLALEQLIAKANFELPDELIAKEVDELAARVAYSLQQENKSEEEIAQKIVEIKAARREESQAELRRFFVLDKIVEKERVIVTEAEVRNAVGMIAMYNQKSPEEMYTSLRDSGRLGTLRNQLRETKAREKLRKKVTVKDA